MPTFLFCSVYVTEELKIRLGFFFFFRQRITTLFSPEEQIITGLW